MSDPKWKKFEKTVYKIQKELVQDAEVKLNDSIKGKTSKIKRQVDISIKRNIGQFGLMIVIDCKDYRRPVDVKEVDGFATVVNDICAHKGALVSSSGFTKGAIEQAKSYGIDTFRLVDTNSVDWKVYASIPVLLERSFIQGYRLALRGFSSLPMEITNVDHRTLRVFDIGNNFIGRVQDIIANRWNNKEIKHAPGEKTIEVGNVYLEVNRQLVNLLLSINLMVAREYFLGDLPVDVRGLKNEQTGGIVTKGFTTDFIKPFEIEQGKVKGWKKINNIDRLSVKPFFRMTYNDVLPSGFNK